MTTGINYGLGPVPTGAPTGAQTPQPIDVPAGYTAPPAQETTDLIRQGANPMYLSNIGPSPLYYDGAQWGDTPGFPNDVNGVIQLQQMLIRAGYLNPRAVIVGQWDSTSAAAYAQLLGSANQAGVDWQTALARSLSTADQTTALSGSARGPLQVQLANPDDLKNVAQNVAQTLQGGNLSEEDLNRFVTSYQSMQSGTQTQAYNTGLTGGTVTAPPTAAVAAETQIRAEHPDQVAVTAFGNRLNDVIGGLIGPHYA